MTDLNELLSLIKYPSKEKVDLITKAYHYAEKAHLPQKRYSGEPYFIHVVETAKILAQLGMGRRTISAGLLHDVLEDAGIGEEEFEKEFGSEILFLVQGVTKLGTIRYKGEERHIESLRKFFVAMAHDIRVLVIKLADRLHNMRTLDHVPQEKRRRIALETMEIYVPLAYRLGIRKIKRELEDLAFKHIEPEKYEEISQLLKNRGSKQADALEKFKKSLLKALAKENVLNVATDYRLKSFYSIYKKVTDKQRDIDRIYDIYALRINVDSIADCYKVLGIIHGTWRPLPGRIKDYIAFPKPNGYQSLHTTIFTGDGGIIEIQIRTHEMHEKAEFGLASHAAYKENDLEINPNSWIKQFFTPETKSSQKNIIDEKRVGHIPDWIKELVDVQSYVNVPTQFMNNLKSDFFEHRMFIFDRKGEVIDLPIGSKPLDFAYELNPEIGNCFYGARVNGKFIPIDTELKNGDIVEIITKKTPQVSLNWLDYCKTSNAKRHIKEALATLNKDSDTNQLPPVTSL